MFGPGVPGGRAARVVLRGVRGAARAVVHLATRALDVEHVAPPQRRRVVEDGRYRALQQHNDTLIHIT